MSRYYCLVSNSRKLAVRSIVDVSGANLNITGAGESGKSTILKQMRLIYTEGFTHHERKEVRQVIFSNMVVAFKIIAEEMRDLGLQYSNPATEVRSS